MLRIGAMSWGPFSLDGLGAVARREGVFERYMTPLLTVPVVGALGGNAFAGMRVEIDYATEITYIEQAEPPNPHDLNLVALTLRSNHEGWFQVAGVQQPGIDQVEPGDRLLAVDGQALQGMELPQAAATLCGRPGDTRVLLLDRAGEQTKVSAPVVRAL